MHISRRDISLGRLIHLCRRRTDDDDAACGRRTVGRTDGRRNERWTPIPQSGRRRDGMTVQRPQGNREESTIFREDLHGRKERLLQSRLTFL